jgi:hypothetical protein
MATRCYDLVEMRRVAAIAVVVGVVSACGGRQPVETAWVMPDLASGPSAGYPFAPTGLGAGADAATADGPRGDHPEMAFADTDGFWRVDEGRAVREARATGRGVCIDFYAEWSEGSRRLEEEVLSDVEVRAALLERYVPLRIDVTEETMRGREQLERFRVNRLPALLLLGPDGAEDARVGRVVSPRELVDRIKALVHEE